MLFGQGGNPEVSFANYVIAADGAWSPVRKALGLGQPGYLGDWQAGSRINLELSLKLGDELGGHLVYGHVDGVGRIVSMTPEGGSVRFVFEAPDGSPDLWHA